MFYILESNVSWKGNAFLPRRGCINLAQRLLEQLHQNENKLQLFVSFCIPSAKV